MSFDLPQLVSPAKVVPEPVIDHVGIAMAEAAAIREQAYVEGFSAGRAEGRELAAPEMEALRMAVLALEEFRTHVADGLERGSVALALRIAEQVIGTAVSVDPEIVVSTVRGALRRLTERERVQILVNPGDLEIVREALDDLVKQLGGIGTVDVQAERRVQRGGAIVRTRDGDVDASIETKLARVGEVLEREFAGGD